MNGSNQWNSSKQFFVSAPSTFSRSSHAEVIQKLLEKSFNSPSQHRCGGVKKKFLRISINRKGERLLMQKCKKTCLHKKVTAQNISSRDHFQRPRKYFWHRTLPTLEIVIWVTMNMRVLLCGCLAICELREREKGSFEHINWPAPTQGLASSFSRSRSRVSLSTSGWKLSFLLASREKNVECSPNCVVVFSTFSRRVFSCLGKYIFLSPNRLPIFFLRRLRIV